MNLVGVLWAVMILSAVSVPGNLMRWIVYRTLVDALATVTGVVLIAASGLYLFQDHFSTYLGQSNVLIVSGVLWCTAAVLVALTFIQTQVVQRENLRQRTEGLGWWERTMYEIGFVEFGRSPQELRGEEAESKPAVNLDIEAHRGQTGLALLVGGVLLLVVGMLGWVFLRDSKFPEKLWLGSFGLGLVGSALGGIDFFVHRQMKRYGPREPDPPSKCPTCGYNLAGLPGRRCPECGNEF